MFIEASVNGILTDIVRDGACEEPGMLHGAIVYAVIVTMRIREVVIYTVRAM
jgi:hypothetical protein